MYVLNRSPTKGVVGKTLYEAWHGRKPVVHHLRTFGCIAYVKDTSPNLKKLDDRSHPMIFVGGMNKVQKGIVFMIQCHSECVYCVTLCSMSKLSGGGVMVLMLEGRWTIRS
jgi:hypothetical protein